MLIDIRRGLDVPVDGKPEQVIYPAVDPKYVAAVCLDYPYARPTLDVQEGDSVAKGQALYHERGDPAICFCAPASGYVREINRGARRRVDSIVIEVEGDRVRQFPGYSDDAVRLLDGDEIAETLLASGLWTAFRTRPNVGVPVSTARPVELFVTAIDTSPLAPDPRVIMVDAQDDFQRGLILLSRLTRGTVYLCAGPGRQLPTPDVANVVSVQFAGPHPAGLPGTHMYHLSSNAFEDGSRWHVGYQDVIAMGYLFSQGELPSERIVALGGGGVIKPRLLRTRLGADLTAVLEGELHPSCRVISGSVLTGRQTNPATRYVARFHSQISVLPEHTGVHNSTGMLAVEAFEEVWPFGAPPLPLLRALLIRDTEMAAALGCGDLDVEDLALCSYVCPARLDYGHALLETLSAMKKLA